MLYSVGKNGYQNTRKKSTEVQLCQEAGKLYPRLIIVEPDTALKMFKTGTYKACGHKMEIN